jgi:hypothetical protein
MHDSALSGSNSIRPRPWFRQFMASKPDQGNDRHNVSLVDLGSSMPVALTTVPGLRMCLSISARPSRTDVGPRRGAHANRPNGLPVDPGEHATTPESRLPSDPARTRFRHAQLAEFVGVSSRSRNRTATRQIAVIKAVRAMTSVVLSEGTDRRPQDFHEECADDVARQAQIALFRASAKAMSYPFWSTVRPGPEDFGVR